MGIDENKITVAEGKGFIGIDMGFKNTAGPKKEQAVALRSSSDHSIFYRCSFDAYQDTLYAHSNRQFYRDCYITGTVDFIFGNAAVIFQNCSIQPRKPLPKQFNAITAQSKSDPNQNTGISIQRCRVFSSSNINNTTKTYLGRPWTDYSTTIFMESDIGGVVDPAGWTQWTPNVDPRSSIFYAEYQNTGMGSLVNQRVQWGGYRPTLTEEEAKKFSVESFLQGILPWLTEASVVFDAK